jgi:parallel beta-helix repeat protein
VAIDGSRNTIRDNRIRGGSGIIVGAPGKRNLITRNRVHGASDSIAIEKGRGNLVSGNRVSDGGIRLGIGSPSIGGGHNVVRRNVVRRSDGDAFHVYVKDGHSSLRRNVAVGAAGDGFDIDNDTTTVTANRAIRSSELAFEAVHGVIDGGRNLARGSGDRRECINIRCGRSAHARTAD